MIWAISFMHIVNYFIWQIFLIIIYLYLLQTTLGFEAHQDTMKRSGSTAKNRYIV